MAHTRGVVKLTVAGLKNTAPPSSPGEDTGGYCSAAWQAGELLYVLVVRVPEDRRASGAYEDCLVPPGLVT